MDRLISVDKLINKIHSEAVSHKELPLAWHEGMTYAAQIALSEERIEPKQEWIPCEEGLPKREEGYWHLVTIYFPRGKTSAVKFGHHLINNEWEYYACEGGTYETRDGEAEVVAWMPLPKPYEGSK